MYQKNSRQLEMEKDPLLFGGIPLNAENRWVKYANLIPWEKVEDEYIKNLNPGRSGEKAKSARMALGSLLIKEKLNLSDRETVEQIRENPYLQYFLGEASYQYKLSLDASLLVHFRKRFPAEILAQINPWIIDGIIETEDPEDKDPHGGNGPEGDDHATQAETLNQGTLIIDATCAPADIQYPTDTRLLHEARLELEKCMDYLQEGCSGKKPRSYRRKANREYKRFCRNRKPRSKEIRKAIKKQLSYVGRDLRHIETMKKDSMRELTEKQKTLLKIIEKMYKQQKEMYETKTHQCEDRIVSIHQPHVRPIKRGKATADTEFGAKLSIRVHEGYCEITKLSWDAYNESTELIEIAQTYYERYGKYPKRILADKIYRTRQNRTYCKKHGIQLSGPPLGAPPKDKILYTQQKQKERDEACERNEVEGKFGVAKRAYGLGRIMTRLAQTSETQIHLIFLVMNLNKLLRNLFSLFYTTFFPFFSTFRFGTTSLLQIY